ncbi:hypothetical protein F4775DRAFT_553083 [Biscogniauxia sp. FL1348]|nr:hypothetical protein F4775DRAFT_553083 [Biscogniauxia sp. FL1348]
MAAASSPVGVKPTINKFRYPTISLQGSRPRTKPKKSSQPLPSGPDEDTADFLFYTKKAQLSSLDQQYLQYGHIGDTYEHCGPYQNWVKQSWAPAPPNPRRIRGNNDAATLLNEFNETIDYARDLDQYITEVEKYHGSLPQELAGRFGPDAFSNMSHKELVDLIVPLLNQLAMLRFRALNSGISDDYALQWRNNNQHEVARAQRKFINRKVHWPRLEKDLWFIRATSVPYQGNDFRRQMLEYYEAIFKMRIGEASNMIRQAMETDPTLPIVDEDKRTNEAKRYCWIIRVINRYVGWKLEISFAVKIVLKEPGEIEEYLARLDRMAWVDNHYEAFLDASLALLDNMDALGAWQAAGSRLWAALRTHTIGRGNPKIDNSSVPNTVRECTAGILNVLEEDFVNSEPISTLPLENLPPRMPYTHPRVRVEDFQIVRRMQDPLYRFDGYVNSYGFRYHPKPGQWTQVQPGTVEMWPPGLPPYTIPSAHL